MRRLREFGWLARVLDEGKSRAGSMLAEAAELQAR
jgi:hypothetical protein